MKTFNQIVNKMFKIKEEDIKDSLTPKEIPNWDSMNYLLFIAELEKEFGVSFTMDEVMNTKSVGDLKTILKSKGKEV